MIQKIDNNIQKHKHILWNKKRPADTAKNSVQTG